MNDAQLLEKCREFGKRRRNDHSWTEDAERELFEFVRDRQRERDREWRAAFGAEDLVPGDDPVKIAKWVDGSYTHHNEEIKREARLEALEQAVQIADRHWNIDSGVIAERIRALSGPAATKHHKLTHRYCEVGCIACDLTNTEQHVDGVEVDDPRFALRGPATVAAVLCGREVSEFAGQPILCNLQRGHKGFCHHEPLRGPAPVEET